MSILTQKASPGGDLAMSMLTQRASPGGGETWHETYFVQFLCTAVAVLVRLRLDPFQTQFSTLSKSSFFTLSKFRSSLLLSKFKSSLLLRLITSTGSSIVHVIKK